MSFENMSSILNVLTACHALDATDHNAPLLTFLKEIGGLKILKIFSVTALF